MILRGQIPKDQLLFESEIEMATKRNRKTKTKERQGDTKEESSITFSFHINIFQEKSNMAEELVPPPRRTLGDYAMRTRALEMKPAFLSLISTHQFTAMDHEDPYTHLSTF